MTKEIWINLPVKDVNKAREFFIKVGFRLNTRYGNSDTSASLFIGSKNIVLMLFAEPIFAGFISGSISNPAQGNEVLFSLDAETKEEVDEMAEKAAAAGGVIFSKPADSQGWMYGCGFADPDGHKWNVLYMDMDKMPR